MSILKITGKFLDQPLLVAKFQKTVPYILSTGGTLYTAHAIKKAEPDKKKETAIKIGTTMAVTVLSALAAPKIANKIFETPTKTIKEIKNANKDLISRFTKKNQPSEEVSKILNKAKDKVLNFNEIKTLCKKLETKKEFLNKLVPEPENISSKEIFSEISRLSFLGLVPVIGGISGGILGDVFAKDNWKSNIPNKIKEGAYQYLANIFLCNVGAGTALAIMEKAGIKGKAPRALGMVAGIVAMGIVGGSAIANVISNKLINPIFGEKKSQDLYGERKPEALDIGLHTDDIATVAVMSGLKWIEPALPIMYAISGFRAGIGYRNVNICNEKKES